MKATRLITFVILLYFTSIVCAQTYISMRPNWTFNTPPSEDSSYEYYVSKGVGNSEKEARKDAFIIAIKEAQLRIGVGSNSSEVFKAFQTSEKDFNVIAIEYAIPMREVCYFSEKSKDGAYYYYQLLQIAIRGNVVPHFRPFAGDCYDFSKAKELREILKEEYKEQIAEQKRIDKEEQIKKEREKKKEVREQKRAHMEEIMDYDRGRYVAWGIAGAGYPWNLVSSIEWRWGGIIGLGLYGDIGMDFTHCGVEGWNKDPITAIHFRYAGGLKFYPYRGIFLDCGYGTICPAKAKSKDFDSNHGVLFHVGYNLYLPGDKTTISHWETGSRITGFFLGVSGGASYDVKNKVYAPSINLKIGMAWGW